MKTDRKRFFYSVAALCGLPCLLAGALTAQVVAVAQDTKVPLSLQSYLLADKSESSAKADLPGLSYSSEGSQELKLDMYQPRSAGLNNAGNDALSPAIVIVHGGSWSRGKRSEYPPFDRWLAENGYIVFDIDYRLARHGCEFPAQIEDVRKAISWITDNAQKYRVDKDRIVLLGRSAGAQLALLAAYTSETLKIAPVRCVISYYAPTDLTWDYANPGFPDVIESKATLVNYIGGAPDAMPQRYENASPLRNVSVHSPPTLLFQGGHDQVVRQENSQRLFEKLRDSGVSVEYIYLPWANHGFDWNFNGWSSQISRFKLLEFLRKYA